MAATLYTADEIGRRTSADYKNNKTPKRDPYCSESAIDIFQEFYVTFGADRMLG